MNYFLCFHFLVDIIHSTAIILKFTLTLLKVILCFREFLNLKKKGLIGSRVGGFIAEIEIGKNTKNRLSCHILSSVILGKLARLSVIVSSVKLED